MYIAEIPITRNTTQAYSWNINQREHYTCI